VVTAVPYDGSTLTAAASSAATTFRAYTVNEDGSALQTVNNYDVLTGAAAGAPPTFQRAAGTMSWTAVRTGLSAGNHTWGLVNGASGNMRLSVTATELADS
jgi:hypothetical protein